MTSKKDNAMNGFQNLWTRLTTPFANDPDDVLREYMTRAILLMQGIALTVFTIPIVVGWITGAFPLEAAIIMLSLLVPTIAGFWWVYHGRWQIARHIPPILFFALGLYFSFTIPLGMTPILFFILAVMLTSMLQGARAYWLVLGLSLMAYFATGAGRSQEPIQFIIESIIMIGGTFTGIALLQWFSISQFQRAILKANKHRGELDDANLNLHAEIAERERAEQELRDSEDKLIEAQKIARLGHYVFDTKTGIWTSSAGLDDIFGTDENFKKDLAGWLQIIHPDSRETMSNYLQDNILSQHQKFNKEYKIIHIITGQERWVHGLGRLKFDDNSNLVEMFGTIQDITERVQAEREIHQRTEDLALINTINAAVNRGESLPEIIRLLSVEAQRVFSCDRATVYLVSEDKKYLEIQNISFLPAKLKQIEKLIGTRLPEIRIPLKEGSFSKNLLMTDEPCLINDSETIQKWMLDFTETIHMPEKFRRGIRKLIPQIYKIVGVQSLITVPLVLEGESIGLLDTSRREPFNEEDAKRVAGVAGQLTAAIRRVQAEEELKRYQNHLEELIEERTTELNVRIREVEELNQAMVNVLEDVQMANQNLEKTSQQLGVANKELESFSYSVSHDLRAPLRHITSFAQLLSDRELGRLDSTSKRYLRNITDASDRMGFLIDDLLDFSQTSRVEMVLRSVDMGEIIKKVKHDLTPEIEGRKITWIVSDLPTVQADHALLGIVWMNLISNAFKFTAPREEARIEIGCRPPEDLGPSESSSEVVFFIRDNGVGFDPKYTSNLFGVFQRLHQRDEFEGTGIGLATVMRIINRHGGDVWAEGREGEGATFYFSLPGQSPPGS